MGVKVVDRDPSLGGLTHAHKVLLHLLLQLLRQGVGRLTAHRQVPTQPGFLYGIIITKMQRCGSGSGAFLTPGSRMGKISGLGSGMNNPDHIFRELRHNFLG
jgi:hypothetical protein